MEISELLDRMVVTVPEGELDGMEVRRFTVTGKEMSSIYYALHGRPCRPGEYTMLRDGHEVWMSDTTSERRDHIPALLEIHRLRARTILLNGLGLGMVLQAALSFDHVESVDVVEKDERVIGLVGPHYEKDGRVLIHHADAFEQAKKWPRGSRWHVAWHDIWPSICSDNLDEMAKLHSAYARRVGWQGSWCRLDCQRLRRRGY